MKIRIEWQCQCKYNYNRNIDIEREEVGKECGKKNTIACQMWWWTRRLHSRQSPHTAHRGEPAQDWMKRFTHLNKIDNKSTWFRWYEAAEKKVVMLLGKAKFPKPLSRRFFKRDQTIVLHHDYEICCCDCDYGLWWLGEGAK